MNTNAKATKNVTLSLPEPLLQRFRVYAAKRNQSMTALMVQAINKLMEQDEEHEKAKRRFLERIRNAPDRGNVTWNRDELYER